MEEEYRAELIRMVFRTYSWDDLLDNRNQLIDLLSSKLNLTKEATKDIVTAAIVIKCVSGEPVSLARVREAIKD